MSAPEYLSTWAERISQSDRIALAQAITLVESTCERDQDVASSLLEILRPPPANTFRLGITGSPGAGKSSLIEKLGSELCNQNRRVAVLAIDPSSSIQGGSILGDQARMKNLSQSDTAFIRASPSSTAKGGITLTTDPVIRLCEAAGFDFIIVETVGTGQNELGIGDVSDAIMLLIDPCSGDGIQAIKKGLLEFSDFVVITKADGLSRPLADATFDQFDTSMPRRINHLAGHPTEIFLSSIFDDQLFDHLLSGVLHFEASLSPHLADIRAKQAGNAAIAALKHLAAEWVEKHPQARCRHTGKANRISRHPISEARSILTEIINSGN